MAKKIGLEKQKELLLNANLESGWGHQNLVKRYIEFCEKRKLVVLPILPANAVAFLDRGKIGSQSRSVSWRGLSAANEAAGCGALGCYKKAIAAVDIAEPKQPGKLSRAEQRALLINSTLKYGNTYRVLINTFLNFCDSKSIDCFPITTALADKFIKEGTRVVSGATLQNYWSTLQSANEACGAKRFLSYKDYTAPPPPAADSLSTKIDFKMGADMLRKYWIKSPGYAGRVQAILRKYLEFCDDFGLLPMPMTLEQATQFINSVRSIKSEKNIEYNLKIMSRANVACGGEALGEFAHRGKPRYTKAATTQRLEEFCESGQIKKNYNYVKATIHRYINFCANNKITMLPITAKKLHRFFGDTADYSETTVKTYFVFFNKANIFCGENPLVYSKDEAPPPKERAGCDTGQWNEEYSQRKQITVMPAAAGDEADEGDERGGYCYKFKVRNGKTVLNNLKTAKAHVRSIDDAPRIYKRVVAKIKNNDIFYRDTAAGKLALEMGAIYAEQ